MQYRRLGKSGLKVSALSFGSWITFGTQIKEEDAIECMQYAYDQGINFFDNAEVYSNGESEVLMGNALKRLGWKRDTYIISSKVFWGGDKPTQLGLSRKHIFDACHAALQRFQTDYLDLYFCHRPDPETPIEETVRAMHDLITQGKVLYWGTSEWSREQIETAYDIAHSLNLHPPTMEQPEYNLLRREKMENEFMPLFEKFGLGTTTWSPLASGLLTGKYLNGIPENSRMLLPSYSWLKARMESEEGQRKLQKVKTISELIKPFNLHLTSFSIAWCLKNPNVSSVILGASRLSQLKENIHALEVVSKITPELMKEVDQALRA